MVQPSESNKRLNVNGGGYLRVYRKDQVAYFLAGTLHPERRPSADNFYSGEVEVWLQLEERGSLQKSPGAWIYLTAETGPPEISQKFFQFVKMSLNKHRNPQKG